MNRAQVQQSLAHDAARLHVTGKARYVDDLPEIAGTLHLAFGCSSVAAGRLIDIDLDATRAAEGVSLVLTASDLPHANDVSPSPYDEPLLATGDVHYIGQPIFLVAASSHMLARKAAGLATIRYDRKDPILTIDDALAADSRFETPLVWKSGDAAQSIARAAHSIEGTIEIGGQEHFYLEGQAALAVPGEDETMHVHSSTQHPTEVQHKVADTLGVPMNAVRVETRRMGGGFGGKESQANSPACACAIAASLTGLPCKMKYDRDDDMIITGKRHDCRIHYQAGFDSDGRLAGVEFLQLIRGGWSLDLTLPVADRAMLHADNVYHIPAMRVESHRLRTNTQSATAFRGFGGPQGMLGIERVMDHIAHSLGKEPLAVRRRNFYLPASAGRHQRSHYGMKVEDCVIEDIVEELASGSRYLQRKESIADWNATSPVLKRGIALTPVKFGISFTLTQFNQAGALVHVYQDGSIHLNHGGTEMGQGLYIKVAQIAADAFGQPVESVQITAADTSKVPNTSATAASSGTDLNGMATKIACDTIMGRLVDFVASQHQVDPSEISFDDGAFTIGQERRPFRDVVGEAYRHRIPLSANGFYATPKIHWDRIRGTGRPFFYFAYGAAVTEVIIDTLTGENRILRTDILHDVGKSINPAIDIGQIMGGYVQGAGWLTTEELWWDDTGSLRTHAPSTYKIPACSDRPIEFNVSLWELGYNREETVYRSKAVGEPPLMLANSVLMALSDAIASTGGDYPALDAPATPERILMTLERVARQRGIAQS